MHLGEQNHTLVLEDKAGQILAEVAVNMAALTLVDKAGQILVEVAVNMAALTLEDKAGHMLVGQRVVLLQPRDHM